MLEKPVAVLMKCWNRYYSYSWAVIDNPAFADTVVYDAASNYIGDIADAAVAVIVIIVGGHSVAVGEFMKCSCLALGE